MHDDGTCDDCGDAIADGDECSCPWCGWETLCGSCGNIKHPRCHEKGPSTPPFRMFGRGPGEPDFKGEPPE